MDNCVFCKIVKGVLPAHKILENDNYLAFLDIFPRNTAQTVVIPKKHLHSKLTENDKDEVVKLMDFALDVAQKIEQKLPEVERCQFVIEGLELDHMHFKLFPAFFPEPKEHVVSQSGVRANEDELQKIANVINS